MPPAAARRRAARGGAPRRGALVLLAAGGAPATRAAAAQDASRTWGDCDPAAVGLGPGAAAHGSALRSCGAALLRGAFSARAAEGLLDAFLRLPPDTVESLRHGTVRASREQTHLPFVPPFSELPLLGSNQALLGPLSVALGPGFVLDLATVVAVPPGGPVQEPHRDSPEPGSVAAHVPLHALSAASAPLALCAGTHSLQKDDAQALLREAILWRPKGESSQEAKRRLYCGGRQRTRAFRLTLGAADLRGVRARDGRLGAAVASAPPGLAGLQAGDEITHAAGRRVAGSDDLLQAVAEAEAGGGGVEIRAERPLVGEGGHQASQPPGLLVAAPLGPGDALLYDSRVFHWGTANAGNTTRYVLYLNFKTSGHAGVHPEARGTGAPGEARAAFQARARRELAAARPAAGGGEL